MKSEVFVKDWNGTAKNQRLHVAENLGACLEVRAKAGQPRTLVTLGGNAYDALRHLERQRLFPHLPVIKRLHHYSYVMMRPDRSRALGPGDPTRKAEWKREIEYAIQS